METTLSADDGPGDAVDRGRPVLWSQRPRLNRSVVTSRVWTLLLRGFTGSLEKHLTCSSRKEGVPCLQGGKRRPPYVK